MSTNRLDRRNAFREVPTVDVGKSCQPESLNDSFYNREGYLPAIKDFDVNGR